MNRDTGSKDFVRSLPGAATSDGVTACVTFECPARASQETVQMEHWEPQMAGSSINTVHVLQVVVSVFNYLKVKGLQEHTAF